MLYKYEDIICQIDELILFLKGVQIDAEDNSHLKQDYLKAHKFYQNYLSNYSHIDDEGRVAMGGLHELYKWIWAVKDSDEFKSLKSHLALLVEAVPKINASTPFSNTVTGKQDDKTNKFIEAIVGFFAVKYGKNVDLDDPVHSSGGTNPDVIFDFDGQRVAIACKTLRSRKPRTIFDNIASATKQISRADCDFGYVLLNAMNIADHNSVSQSVFDGYEKPFNLLKINLEDIYGVILSESTSELKDLFDNNPKVCPIVITVLHSTTRIHSSSGLLSTSLKGTIVTNFNDKTPFNESHLKLPNMFNNFIHNR